MANPGEMAASGKPFAQFGEWLKLAEESEPNDPTAMSIATVDAGGMPNVRMVLMRRWDERGIVFFTNFESQKGSELLANSKAAANFHWKSQRKQVRFRGPIEVVSDAEADEYFFSRPRGSRIGAHASKQSRPLESRFALEKAVAVWSAKCRARTTGRVSASSPYRSSSGRMASSACMTASATTATAPKAIGA